MPASRRTEVPSQFDDVPGRDAAVDLLFRRHYADLLRLAYCVLGERGPAEDSVQEAFVSLYAHWDGLRDVGAAHDYLRSAVINRCRSAVRDRIRERARLARRVVRPTEPSSEEAVMLRAEGDTVASAVRALARRQREVVVCRYYLELSVAETADLLEITDGAVKRHAHRAIAALNSRLQVTS